MASLLASAAAAGSSGDGSTSSALAEEQGAGGANGEGGAAAAAAASGATETTLEEEEEDPADVKVILLGDSAVGKSKLVERFLMGQYEPRQLSTFALTLFRYDHEQEDGKVIKVDFWDTAGQERFASMHPSYYHQAQCCILVFDVIRKVTYKNLDKWYTELRQNCPNIPVICVANKIDVNHKVVSKQFKFPKKRKLPIRFVSAADGTNVAKLFREAIQLAVTFKNSAAEDDDIIGQIYELINDEDLGKDKSEQYKLT